MKPELSALSEQYETALRRYLGGRPPANLKSAQRLGRRAAALGLETLDLAQIHEAALIALLVPDESPARRSALIRSAGKFFAEWIIPIEQTHRTAVEAKMRLESINQELSRSCVDLAFSQRQLRQENQERMLAEKSLRRSERHHAKLLKQSGLMQEQLRLLSRQLLSAQEEERKKISRELHDVIGQTLAGINLRLVELKKSSAINAAGLDLAIASTQELIRKAVDIVHRFARELRPAVLDDLGLIPALHAFLKLFRAETGIHAQLTTYAAVEKLSGEKRTVLYRVAQETLTNVSRHAQAGRVLVEIKQADDWAVMSITDNGRGFQAKIWPPGKLSTRLGLLGMKERLEMVGGRFEIKSSPGRGTTVTASVPLDLDLPDPKRKVRRQMTPSPKLL